MAVHYIVVALSTQWRPFNWCPGILIKFPGKHLYIQCSRGEFFIATKNRRRDSYRLTRRVLAEAVDDVWRGRAATFRLLLTFRSTANRYFGRLVELRGWRGRRERRLYFWQEVRNARSGTWTGTGCLRTVELVVLHHWDVEQTSYTSFINLASMIFNSVRNSFILMWTFYNHISSRPCTRNYPCELTDFKAINRLKLLLGKSDVLKRQDNQTVDSVENRRKNVEFLSLKKWLRNVQGVVGTQKGTQNFDVYPYGAPKIRKKSCKYIPYSRQTSDQIKIFCISL